jgi:nucleotidyltransferase/DNA polymerase involved in DNA repair
MEDSFDFAAFRVQGRALKTSFRRMDVHCERLCRASSSAQELIAVAGGVVLAASNKAKAFGVAVACRDGRRAGSVRYRHQPVDDFTLLVERISINEAFADVAG